MLVVSSTSTSGPISVAIETALTASNFAWPPKFTHPNLDTTGLLVYKNKLPKFNDNLKTFCLNFHGRVTMPSVKNFQLALASEVDDGSGAAGTGGSVRLQFGRVAKDSFTIDVSAPMSVMMGYAIALTTFDAIEKV
ncbi:tubby C-terminal-like domain-containing protein [Blastocladiella britannica]|nr:tubby C-terminal-like domain-containing protein [Blastocladiella britannica]